jgi:hypothetical protein
MDHDQRLNIFSVRHNNYRRGIFLPLFRLGTALEKFQYIRGSCNHQLFRLYLLRTEDEQKVSSDVQRDLYVEALIDRDLGNRLRVVAVPPNLTYSPA